jgi:hypothetical protein
MKKERENDRMNPPVRVKIFGDLRSEGGLLLSGVSIPTHNIFPVIRYRPLHRYRPLQWLKVGKPLRSVTVNSYLSVTERYSKHT